MKIEFEVTEAVVEAAGAAISRRNTSNLGNPYPMDLCRKDARVALTAALAHPSFQSQLRAYVAGEMRKVVPGPAVNHNVRTGDKERASAWNGARAATLANIAAYEKEQEDGQ